MSESDAKWDYIKKTAGEVADNKPTTLDKLTLGALVSKCKDSIHHIDQLSNEGYFVSAALSLEKDGYYEKFIAFVRHEDLYQEPVRKFFEKKFPECDVKFGRKTIGVNLGFTCNVTDTAGKETMFFGKLQQGGSLTKSNEVPDVKEMVVYKLLEMAEIGPEVHFIDTPYSRLKKMVYIVTKDVGSDVVFKDLDDLRSRVKIETVVQIRLIVRLLRLTDVIHNHENWGQKQKTDGQFAPVIIDFNIKLYHPSYKISAEGMSEFKKYGIYESLVEDSLDERQTMDLLRDSLAKWNLERHLEGAKEYIDEFRKEREWIKNGPGLAEYISEVEDNIKDLGKILEEFSKQ